MPKPLCIKHEFQSEEVVHVGTNAPHLMPSLHIPGALTEDLDEAGGVTIEEGSVPAAPKDLNGSNLAAAAKMADIDTSKPCTLMEAIHILNWPPWEKPDDERPDACQVHPVAQGSSQSSHKDRLDTCPVPKCNCRGGTMHPLQPACIDATLLHDHLAGHMPLSTPMDHQVPLSSDNAPVSTAEVPTTCDVPHCKAVNTSNWAALAMHLDTMPSDTNGSIAVDLCATLAHAFPYNGGTGTTTTKPLM
jgi:hypothetical protein